MTVNPSTPERGTPHEGAWRCPTCGRPAAEDAPSRPFCSVRCQFVDLGRWFEETYSMPCEAAIDMDGLAPPGETHEDADARP